MLPGTKYSPEDVVRVVIRRWWLIVALFAIGAAGATAVSRKLPDKFRSETLIMVVPQRIPDSYVKSTVTSSIENRLPTISQQILSRSRLELIIVNFGLYEQERRTELMEDIIQRMRKDIGDIVVRNESTFQVNYVSRDARTAQKVTERLASLFIEENLRDRENLAEDTNQFLDSQLEDARRRLIEHEKKLEEYRRRYSGQLPSQASSNLTAIQNTQMQLQALTDATNREREHRLLVNRQLVDLESPDPVIAALTAPAGAPRPDAPPAESISQQLEGARARLRLLETRAKPDHPDMRLLQRAVRDLEEKLKVEGEQAASGAGAPPERPPTPTEVLRQRRIRELKSQIDQIDGDLQEKLQQEKALRAVAADYQAKLDAVPSRESDLVELTRDYTTLQGAYQSLLTKREESKLAANLERRNIGEQFKILDPARVPERPFSPNRLLIYLAGTGGGLAFGLLLTAFFEYRDSSLKNEDDVVRLFNLPVLALVPVMVSSDERRTRHRRVFYAGIAAVFVLAGAVAAALVLWRA